MTRAEYLEAVQESFQFGKIGDFADSDSFSDRELRDERDVCRSLQDLHESYCRQVEHLLFPENRQPWKDVIRARWDSLVWEIRRLRMTYWERD